jgi:type I restriction enzyme, S subunit
VSAEIQVVRLADVALLNPRLTEELLADTLVSFVPMSAVSAETARVEVTTDRAYSEVSKGYTSFQSGDVLFAKITPCFENGKIAQAVLPRQYGFGSTEFHVIRPRKDKSDARYLHHFLRQERVRVAGEKRMTGSGGQRRVPTNFLSELEIPLPPLPEQRRIAAILDQAETLRTQRRTALALLDTLTQSIFLDMFGDPITNSKKWSTQPLQAGCEVINDCPHTTPVWSEAGVICLRTSNLTVGGWCWDDTRFVPEAIFHDRSKRGYLIPGDIVLSREGTVGIAAIVQSDMELCMGQRLVQVRPSAKFLNPEYLLRHLLYVLSPSKISQLMVGSTSQHLNVKELRALKIPLPPLPLQQTFATRIQAIEALKSTHRTALAQQDALFASLQHRAFSGELTRPMAAAAQALPTQPRSFNDLLQLDTEKGLEALIYVGKRTPKQDLYKALKTVYLADRHHLEHYGCFIYGETYNALPMGPVPQAAYDAAKLLNGEAMFSPFDDAVLRAALRRTDKQLIALRDADFSKLSAAERASLDYAIRYCADMSFAQVKAASHDSAYDKTPKNSAMTLQDLIASLPQKAQQQFFADYV